MMGRKEIVMRNQKIAKVKKSLGNHYVTEETVVKLIKEGFKEDTDTKKKKYDEEIVTIESVDDGWDGRWYRGR